MPGSLPFPFHKPACRRLFWAILAASISQLRAAEVILPPKPDPIEIQAAKELTRVWAQSLGAQPDRWTFTLLSTPIPGYPAPDNFRLTIRRIESSGGASGSNVADGFAVTIHGTTPIATRIGVDYFLQHYVGARWFIPGPLGEVIPKLSAPPTPDPIDKMIVPAFASRDLGGLTGPEGAEWAIRNGLLARWPHNHAMTTVIPSSEASAHPDWFPMLDGERYLPKSAADYNWQPNFVNPAVVAEAARYSINRFRYHPEEEAVSLSENDSIRFDQSPATLAARGPLRWFRGRPDYSNVVFGFMNQVADQVAQKYPDKLLSAYAYYWCENTPTCPVRANVLPWLTADRTQWFDPDFQREDKALIQRWCHSGASTIGVYDYLYGAPYLIPRVPVHLIADSIQFEYSAGVRAYYAECYPHWAYDGPKLWMIAQLLWTPKQSPDALLNEYYAKFYGESARPIKDFYLTAEQAWLDQPKPGRWIKYYQDQDQALLFPPKVRSQLFLSLAAATAASRPGPAAERTAAASAAFTATDAICKLIESRSSGSPLLNTPEAAVTNFNTAYAHALEAGAMSKSDTSVYLRIVPTQQTAGLLPPDHSILKDPSWDALVQPPASNSDSTFLWSPKSSPWIARGEPSEHRQITLSSNPKAVRYSGAVSERILQWIILAQASSSSKSYRAATSFRGRVTPGNESFLIVSFLNANNEFVGNSLEARIRPGRYSEPIQLALKTLPPPSAKRIGAGIYVYHQNPGDWAEFTTPALISEP